MIHSRLTFFVSFFALLAIGCGSDSRNKATSSMGDSEMVGTGGDASAGGVPGGGECINGYDDGMSPSTTTKKPGYDCWKWNR